MDLFKQTLTFDDLTERLARLTERFIDIGSEDEIFESIGEEFAFTAWTIDGPFLRERYVNWGVPGEVGSMKPIEGGSILPFDLQVIPPHFFSRRRFIPTPKSGLTEAVLRSMRDPMGKPLPEAWIRTALQEDPGVFGPIVVGGAPWGVIAIRWPDASERALDLFTLFGSHLGAALHLVGTRAGLVRAERELRAIHSLAREESSPAPANYLRILESAAAVTESDTSSLFLLEEETAEIHLAGHFGASCEWTKGNVLQRDEFFQKVVASGEPLVVERMRPEQPWIALLPLRVESRTLGILLIARQPTERPYGFQEVARARLLAGQLAVQLENAALLGETRRQNELLHSLYRLSRLLSRSQGDDLPLESALELLVDGLGFDGAWVFAQDGDSLVCKAEAGGIQLPFPEPHALDSSHPIATVFREREPYLGPGCSESGDRTFLVLPLESANQTSGCLVVTRDGGIGFEDHDFELLGSYGAQIALALDHAKLRSMEKNRVRQLRFLSEVGQIATNGRLDKKKLLSGFLQGAASTLGFDTALGILPHEEGGEELWLGEHPLPSMVRAEMRRLASQVRESRCNVRETIVPFGERTVQVCAMPARSPAGVQAVFALARRDIPVSLQEFETLSAAGSNLGFALEDADRFEKAQKSLDEMKLILDVGRAVTSTSDPEAFLETTAHTVNQLVGASRTVIFLYEEATDELTCAALSSEAGAPVRQGQRFQYAREIFPEGIVTIERPSEAPDDCRLYEKGDVMSSLTVPLQIADEPIGCIWIADETRPRKWSPALIERVKVIAHQVAIGIANFRLHDDLRASNLELARAQEELIKKERLAALGELAAVVAHEVRNPLGVIFNSMSSLKRLIRPEGDVKTLLEIVTEEADRLDRIVNDLLDFSRPNPIQPGWTDLGALVSELAATFPAEPGSEIRLEVEPELPLVNVDARLLRQALLNLVQNGMQAMPKGGTLGIRVRRETREGKKVVAISIRDEGVGIPEELFTKIFEPFFTTKATGSGLGLALVKRIAEAHRGSLEFRSTLGKGSEFTIVVEATEGEE